LPRWGSPVRVRFPALPKRGAPDRVGTPRFAYRRRGQVVRQRTANPPSPVRIRAAPLFKLLPGYSHHPDENRRFEPRRRRGRRAEGASGYSPPRRARTAAGGRSSIRAAPLFKLLPGYSHHPDENRRFEPRRRRGRRAEGASGHSPPRRARTAAGGRSSIRAAPLFKLLPGYSHRPDLRSQAELIRAAPLPLIRVPPSRMSTGSCAAPRPRQAPPPRPSASGSSQHPSRECVISASRDIFHVWRMPASQSPPADPATAVSRPWVSVVKPVSRFTGDGSGATGISPHLARTPSMAGGEMK